MSASLDTYTIYDSPADFPNCWVVRRWTVKGTDLVPDDTVVIAPSLDKARSIIPPGLVVIPRSEDDDPTIYETWL